MRTAIGITEIVCTNTGCFPFHNALIQLPSIAERPSQRIGGGYKLVKRQKPKAIIAPAMR